MDLSKLCQVSQEPPYFTDPAQPEFTQATARQPEANNSKDASFGGQGEDAKDPSHQHVTELPGHPEVTVHPGYQENTTYFDHQELRTTKEQIRRFEFGNNSSLEIIVKSGELSALFYTNFSVTNS